MTLAPLDLILLLGSLQGFILATLLWTNKRGHRLSNQLLAVIIGLLALMSLAVGIPITNRWVSLAIDLFPMFMVMPIGPLIYFYVKSGIDPEFKVGRAERMHFLPVVLDWGSPLIGWLFFTGLWLGFLEQTDGRVWGHMMNEYNTYADIPRWFSLTIYLFLTNRLLERQPSTITVSETDQKNRRWLRQFVNVFLIFQTIWFLFMVPYIVPGWRNSLLDQLGWYPIYIPITILIYWFGLRGYLHTRSEISTKLPSKSVGAELPMHTVERAIYTLSIAMEQEKLFLDPELTVEKLGQHTQLPPKIISAVLNQHMRKNFNGFINGYRVDEVKQRVTNPAFEHLTLTGIAFNCGFNSQATFQRTFKQLTGVSPGEYATQQKNSAQIQI